MHSRSLRQPGSRPFALRIAFACLALLQVGVFAMVAASAAREGRSAVSHVEPVGVALHYAHDESICCASAGVTSLGAQRPDSVARARRDSIAAADSIRLVRELERIQNEPRAQQPPAQRGAPGGGGSTNPRLLPDVSAVGDLVGDLS